MTLEVSARVTPATVAIVGRPNVGKSALFNRLVGKRMAIVDDEPGVTRDRLYALAEWRGRTFSVVDTAGIDTDAAESDDMARETRAQAEIAANDADVIVFVVDAVSGLMALDDDVVHIMRKTRRPVILVANKAESERVRHSIPGEFARLGFGEPIAISALHGEGTGDLLDAIFDKLPAIEDLPEAPEELALAIVGRPNVGKSSLLNSLIGETRSIVSDVAGTTRDAIDTLFTYEDHTIRLIDTAGVWRKTKHHGSIEYYASLRSLGAIARSDIAILVIDTMAGILDQDRRMAGMVLEERKGLIIVANKWDLALAQDEEYSQSELIEVIHEALPFARFAPVTFLSALTKRRLNSLMPLVLRVRENLDRRIPTPQVNAVIRDAIFAHPPPNRSGHPLKIYYAAQVATHPPLFVFHCNDPELVTITYKRFLDNTLRSNFDFEGVPIGLEFRARRDPDAGAEKRR
jgi:GTP-binding protein